MDDIQLVIEFAVKAHKGQIRKDSELPYIVHPIAVLKKLAEWGIQCRICWKAALCHDVLEDCPDIDFERLWFAIGIDAANIVQELTFVGPKEDKPAYMDSFATKSVQALVVKVADRLCNTEDFEQSNPVYAVKYMQKAEGLFRAMEMRKDEIVANFGEKTFKLMSDEI